MYHKLKELIKSNPILFDLAKKTSRLFGFKDVMYNYIVNNPYLNKEGVFFLQIGASDGIRNDPFREHIIQNNWSGIFVEPIPWAYKELRKNYLYKSSQNLKFVNAAISIDNSNNLNLYTFKEDFLMSLPMTARVNYQQKTSFNKTWVLNHAPTEDVIEKISVPSYSVTEIIKQYSIKKDLELMAIDAEGLDAEIIMSLDFSVVKPKTIFFEHHTLGKSYDTLMNFLTSNGYLVTILGDWDAVAELN